MTKTLRKITRSSFTERLGLYGPDLTRRPNSAVADAETTFRSVNGDTLGKHIRSLCPITGESDDVFLIALDTSVTEDGHAQIWA